MATQEGLLLKVQLGNAGSAWLLSGREDVLLASLETALPKLSLI